MRFTNSCTTVALALFVSLRSSGAGATNFVYMAFDGAPSFPSITVTHPTAGLADFTGSAFGITNPTDTSYLEGAIQSLVQTDYAAYDITFVTTEPIVGPYDVWGIDDSAYTFSDSCGMTTECQRLFGKASASGYARTWAGSLSLDGSTNPYGGSATSSPELDITTHTLDQIAQAMANNAAHEIAHLFGVAHEGLDAGNPSQTWNLMETNVESTMASTNKYFSTAANSTLLSSLGCNPAFQGCGNHDGGDDQNPPIPEPTSAVLFGLGALLFAGAWRQRE